MDNTCICCGRIIPEGRHICLSCGDYDDQQRFKPDALPIVRTNGDRIRAMTDKELARFISLQQMHMELTGRVETEETIRKWLESEAEP